MQSMSEIQQFLGLGCARIHAGVELTASINLVREAYDLGIRHFDTAPSYGLGQSEIVLGKAFSGANDEVHIASKVGILPPKYPGLTNVARSYAKGLVALVPAIKPFIVRGVQRAQDSQKIVKIDPRIVSSSIDSSLRRLKMSHIECLLLHEVRAEAVTEELIDALLRLRGRGLINKFGSSTGKNLSELAPVGTVRQCLFDIAAQKSVASDSSCGEIIYHGAMRYSAQYLPQLVARSPIITDVMQQEIAYSGRKIAFGALAIVVARFRTASRILFSVKSSEDLRILLGSIRRLSDLPELSEFVNEI